MGDLYQLVKEGYTQHLAHECTVECAYCSIQIDFMPNPDKCVVCHKIGSTARVGLENLGEHYFCPMCMLQVAHTFLALSVGFGMVEEKK